MINGNEKLRVSCLFLACGTIIKDRMIKNRHGQFVSTSEWDIHLNMEKVILQYNKRNTVEINELVVFTAQELKNQTTIFNVPHRGTRKNQLKEELENFKCNRNKKRTKK